MQKINYLELFLSYNLENKWNWNALSQNNSISLNYIKDHLYFPWSYYYLSNNENVTLEFIIENKEKSWNWRQLSSKFSCIISNNDSSYIINDKILNGIYIDLPWDWYEMSKNPEITIHEILNYGLPWDIEGILLNPNINLQTILTCKKLFYNNKTNSFNYIKERIDWNIFSFNKNINESEILSNINLPWNFTLLRNIDHEIIINNIKPYQWEYYQYISSVPFHIIQKYSYLSWNWIIISEYANVTLEEVLINDMPWNYYYLSRNKNISVEIISYYETNLLDWDAISSKPLTIDFIIKHISCTWNWKILSVNKYININDILRYNLLPWDDSLFNYRKDISLEIIKNTYNLPWDFFILTNSDNITICDIYNNKDLNWDYNVISSKKI